MTTQSLKIHTESTPNPNSLKFVLDRNISQQNFEFKRQDGIHTSPLAKKLFGFPWVDGVMIGTNFISIQKQDWVDWDSLSDALSSLIGEHIENDWGIEPVQMDSSSVLRTSNPQNKEKSAHSIQDTDSEVVQKIKQILDAEIRPAVAMDGGDVLFHSYQNHILYLHLKGSCQGCPSSTQTLKVGILGRLKNLIPEIMDVESV